MNLKILIPIACSLLTLSCVKSSDNKKQGTFIIKGQIIQDCAGNKVTDEKLYAEYFNKGSWVKAYQNEDIGNGKTGSQGEFELTLDNYGAGEYRITGSSNRIFVRRNLNPQSTPVVDLKTLYYEVPFYIVIKFLLTGSFSTTDTLFLGGRTIYPLTAGTYYQEYYSLRSTGEETQKQTTLDFEWSIGKNGIKNKFSSTYAPCKADTTAVNVSK